MAATPEKERRKKERETTILYLVARHVDAGVHDFDVGYGTLVKRGVTVRKQLIKELISRARLQNKPKFANFSKLGLLGVCTIIITLAFSFYQSSVGRAACAAAYCLNKRTTTQWNTF